MLILTIIEIAVVIALIIGLFNESKIAAFEKKVFTKQKNRK